LQLSSCYASDRHASRTSKSRQQGELIVKKVCLRYATKSTSNKPASFQILSCDLQGPSLNLIFLWTFTLAMATL